MHVSDHHGQPLHASNIEGHIASGDPTDGRRSVILALIRFLETLISALNVVLFTTHITFIALMPRKINPGLT